MEELLSKNNSLESDSSCFNATDVFAKKYQEQRRNTMFEGKNIHSSPIDGKLLCSYSEKLCKQRRLNGYAFCIRHVLEDRQAPFRQCQFVAKYNGHQCTNPIPLSEDRIYCNSHLQVLGLIAKKSKRRKACESGVGETGKLAVFAPEQKARPDVFSTPASMTNNFSNSAMAFPPNLKRPKFSSLESTEPKIPAIEELKENRRRLRRDRNDLFAIYGIDSSDSESSDSEQMPWQQMWLSSDNEHKATHEDTEHSYNGEATPRTAKISKLSSRLRRELHQLHRTLRAHRYKSKDLQSLGTALLKAAQADAGVCVESLGTRASRRQRTKPTPCPQKACASVQNESQCKKTALPYTKFCLDHIMSETKQGLYAQCTAKWPGGLQCSVPVFDISHERPLCEEHAFKKAKSQEAQVEAQATAACAHVNKQQPKKPRRKPQPRATPGTKVPRPAKKPSSRKVTPRSSKLKTGKGLDASITGASAINHSFSPDNSADILSSNMALSSDYSQNSNTSPMSSDLTDFEQFGNSLFDAHRQDSLSLSNVSDGDSGHNMLPSDLTSTTNGTSSEQQMFHSASPTIHISQWNSTSSMPASVISSTPRVHGSGALINSFRVGAKTDPKSKATSLSRKIKGNQLPKPKEAKKSQSKQPTCSLGNMLQNSRFISSDLYEREKSVKHLIQNSDPMFSPPHGLPSSGDLKSRSNGEHVHSPPPHIGMDMGAILSPTQRAWSSVPGVMSPSAYTSPLNSQTNISRLTSPPFSPPSISPRISPHPTITSLFTFERTQLQQTHLNSPSSGAPSPPPFMQSGQLKQPFHHQHNDLEHQEGDVDPFLPSVEREQPIFGSHFTQNSDSNIGDLRLR